MPSGPSHPSHSRQPGIMDPYSGASFEGTDEWDLAAALGHEALPPRCCTSKLGMLDLKSTIRKVRGGHPVKWWDMEECSVSTSRNLYIMVGLHRIPCEINNDNHQSCSHSSRCRFCLDARAKRVFGAASSLPQACLKPASSLPQACLKRASSLPV